MGIKQEYRVDMKIRNNLFVQRIEQAGYKTVGEFCRIHKLNQSDLGEVIAMKISPLMSNGKFRVQIEKAADILECMPEDLFTEKQLDMAIKTNKHCLLVNEAEMKYMLETNQPQKMLEQTVHDEQKNKLLEETLKSIPLKEQKILRLRFGLDDGIEHTLEEIGQEFGCTRTRIRQIEARALRRLRHPSKSDPLREFINQGEC